MPEHNTRFIKGTLGSAIDQTNLSEILDAWINFTNKLGLYEINSEADYERSISLVDAIVDVIRSDESHPLAEVLDVLSKKVWAYENVHCPIEKSPPHEMLAFLMEQQGMTREDIRDCAPGDQIDDFLSGKYQITPVAAQAFARRLNISIELFL